MKGFPKMFDGADAEIGAAIIARKKASTAIVAKSCKFLAI
jgi:hypothetical protein